MPELKQVQPDGYIFEVPPIVEAHEHETFHVHDEKTANWVVRKINEARASKETVKKWAAEETGRAEAEEAHLLERFGPELEAFATTQLEGQKGKSLRLPNGTLSLRLQSAKLDFVDEQAVGDWALKNLPAALPESVVVDLSALSPDERLACYQAITEVTRPLSAVSASWKAEKLRRSVVNDYFKETGDIPDGCEFVPARDKFEVK